jgi:ABC-type transporter Mla subunit MlaD
MASRSGKQETGKAGAQPAQSRVPAAVGSIPLLGGFVKGADAQAQWVADLLEQNARLVGQLPATLKSFNDGLERFNQTVTQLDRSVARIEQATRALTGPLDRVASAAGAFDPKTLRELPDTLDTLRREAVPALRAATDTQRQVASLAATIDRVVALIGELPGMGVVRRLRAGRPDGIVDTADAGGPAL